MILSLVATLSRLMYIIHFIRYLRQVIDETLRCAVVAPWAARFQDYDSQLGGHFIPKNVSQALIIDKCIYSILQLNSP